MNSKVKMNALFFVFLGAMNGAIISLVACYFLEYMLNSYSLECTLTYTDWLLVCTPCFAVIGALFNLAAAIFMYEEPKKKLKFWHKK